MYIYINFIKFHSTNSFDQENKLSEIKNNFLIKEIKIFSVGNILKN